MKAKEVEAQKRRRAEANMTKQVSKSNEIKIVMPMQIPRCRRESDEYEPSRMHLVACHYIGTHG